MKDASNASIERALGLEFGSMDKWSKEGYPTEAQALFRILKLFPWMLLVAEDKYNKQTSDIILKTEAFSMIFERLYEYNGFLTEV